VEGWRRWVRLGVVLGLLLVLYFLIPASGQPDRTEAIRIAVCVVLVALLTALVVWQVRLQMIDSSRHVDGLLIALVVAVLSFATAFYVTSEVQPGQIVGLHTRLDALYFTMTTLMTVGFGDIHATGQFARAIVLVQMVFNVAVIATAATAISRRIREKALEHAEHRRAAGEPERPAGRRRIIRGGRRQDRRTHRNPT
jgi:voltage-gated potassium channel